MTKSKTVLIIGGAGYIGSHVNKCLHDHGFSTVIFDNLSTGFQSLAQWGTFVRGDILSSSDLDLCFNAFPIDAVVHLAAKSIVPDSLSQPSFYYENNVLGTFNVLEAMRRHGVRSIIFSSTCAIYGEPLYSPLDEGHPKKPITPYGKTKRMIEDILEDYARAYGVSYASLRYFNAVGADETGAIGERHDPETHLIPRCLNALHQGDRVITVYGDDFDTPDGTCIRDYVHVSDIAQAHRLALSYLKNERALDINLGTGVGHSVLEVIREIEQVTGQALILKKQPRRIGDTAQLVSSYEKAKRLLSWSPSRTLSDAIASAWHYTKTNTLP